MRRLEEKVRLQSVNSLGNIYPEDIMDWLEVSGLEAKKIIDALHEERVIVYKYRFKCKCGELCTVYEKKIVRDNNFNCEICGEKYSLNDIKEQSEIVYEIDKKVLLSLENEMVNFNTLSEVKGRVVSITSINRKEEEDMKKIFIGSSKNVVRKLEDIARYIDDLGGKALPWNAKGTFVAGQYTFDTLIKIAHEVDGAIFIFNGEDETWYSDRVKSEKEVRDNVLLEYGLFAGVLGRDKVAFICENRPKIASDLSGITYIDGEQTEYQIKPDIEAWFKHL